MHRRPYSVPWARPGLNFKLCEAFLAYVLVTISLRILIPYFLELAYVVCCLTVRAGQRAFVFIVFALHYVHCKRSLVADLPSKNLGTTQWKSYYSLLCVK